MKRALKLFSVSTWLVHNFVYAWANVLCVTLEKCVLVPTRSQLPSCYTKSVIKDFGRANIFELFNATELGAEVGLMKTVNAFFTLRTNMGQL
jgi:hypothetical protein